MEDRVGWGAGVECGVGPLLSSAVAPGSLPLRHESLGTEGAAWEVERKQGEQMELNSGQQVACPAAADRRTCVGPQ